MIEENFVPRGVSARDLFLASFSFFLLVRPDKEIVCMARFFYARPEIRGRQQFLRFSLTGSLRPQLYFLPSFLFIAAETSKKRKRRELSAAYSVE